MWFTHDSNQSIPAVPILSQGITGAFAQSVPEYGMALVYPEAFDSLVILMPHKPECFPFTDNLIRNAICFRNSPSHSDESC